MPLAWLTYYSCGSYFPDYCITKIDEPAFDNTTNLVLDPEITYNPFDSGFLNYSKPIPATKTINRSNTGIAPLLWKTSSDFKSRGFSFQPNMLYQKIDIDLNAQPDLYPQGSNRLPNRMSNHVSFTSPDTIATLNGSNIHYTVDQPKMVQIHT